MRHEGKCNGDHAVGRRLYNVRIVLASNDSSSLNNWQPFVRQSGSTPSLAFQRGEFLIVVWLMAPRIFFC